MPESFVTETECSSPLHRSSMPGFHWFKRPAGTVTFVLGRARPRSPVSHRERRHHDIQRQYLCRLLSTTASILRGPSVRISLPPPASLSRRSLLLLPEQL